jgi:hypothetical protein
MKINTVYLHGFGPDAPDAGPALIVAGDEDSIRITKGPQFDAWMANEAKVINKRGEESTCKEENFKHLEVILGAWLHDMEVEGWEAMQVEGWTGR